MDVELKEKYDLPDWMDCAWRRLPCGREECRICGRIMEDRQRHLDRGEDPDSMEAVIEDVSRQFGEAMEILQKDAARMGIDLEAVDEAAAPPAPPEPDAYPLYHRLKEWRENIYEMAEAAGEDLDAWPSLEAGQDLLWYANTLLVKTIRQLNNRWSIDRGEEYQDMDYDYTGYVLRECLAILNRSLSGLARRDQSTAARFDMARMVMNSLEKEIRAI